MISALGTKPDGLFYNWNPLWQMDDAQAAEIAVKQATVMKADVDAGLMDPLVLQKARENQLIESTWYPGIEQIIVEFGTDIDEREPSTEEKAAQLALEAQAAGSQIDPKTGKPMPPAPANNNLPKAVPKKKVVGEDAVIESMAERIRDAELIDQSTPRTLYVYRPVLNWRDVAKHYKAQGVQNVLDAEMHVTVCYSKKPVDWLKVGEEEWNTDDKGNLRIKAGGPRVNEKFGKYLVLGFASSPLSWRHRSINDRTDASWDYEDYTPHISISMDAGAVDPLTMPAYQGEIVLGPEVFEEIKPSRFNNPARDEIPFSLPNAFADALSRMPPAQVTVTVPVTVKGKAGKETVRVTKHDGKGRISEFERVTDDSEDE